MASGATRSGQETTIVDNEEYNLLTALTSKREGLAAYDKYERGGQANAPIWQELRTQDEQSARQLLPQLGQFAQHGKLRAR